MYCPNSECPFALEHGSPAEFNDKVLTCVDCGTELLSGEPPPPPADTAPSPFAGSVPSGRLVTLAAYDNPEAAYHAREILEASGVRAFVGDDHVAGIVPPLSMVTGGIKVEVPEEEAETASRVLRELLSVGPDAEPDEQGDAAEGEEGETSDELPVGARRGRWMAETVKWTLLLFLGLLMLSFLVRFL